MKEQFKVETDRATRFSLHMPEIFLVYSKNRINQTVFDTLVNLAKETELETWRNNMFSGEQINRTEQRSLLHVALRDRSKATLKKSGVNITESVESQLSKIQTFVELVRHGQWKGCSGERITDIVSIGVGGSNLGPQMVTEALTHLSDDRLRVHYVSNVDATQITEVLRPLKKVLTS